MLEGARPCNTEFKLLGVQDAGLIAFSWKWFSPPKTHQPLKRCESQQALGRPSSTAAS